MTALIRMIVQLHNGFFGALTKATDGWFMGLFARFSFASVLYFYFLNSAQTKVGDGLLGFFSISPGAYYQIALPAVEAAGGDVDAVSFIPWGVIVMAGTYGEFILPILVVIGLFSRVASLGMIIFVAVQSYVDIAVHQVDAKTIGSFFDRFPDGLIVDQRLLWIVPLVYVVLKGPGLISLDTILARRSRF